MLTSAELLAELLMDAKRVAAYGQRTGRLTDFELLSAIAAVDALPQPTWNAPEVLALQAALNRAAHTIAPTGIADLRSGWDPFSPPKSRPAPIIFIGLTFLLMIFTAIATLDYNQGKDLIAGIETLHEADPRAASKSILRQLMAAVVLADSENEAPPSALTRAVLDETHLSLINELHRIDDRLELYINRTSSFRGTHPLPNEIINGTVRAIGRVLGVIPEDKSQQPDYGPYNQCETIGDEEPQVFKTNFRDTSIAKVMTSFHMGSVDIVCAEKLSYHPLTLPDYEPFAQDMRDWVKFWGLWYLPALYGALGAALYYMRRILDTTIPDPPLIRILHRVALGAFAGVIVTWFWSPELEGSDGIANIGVTAFTLAFLIGFSVEVLFALLDRTVATLIEMARGGKAPPAAPPAQPQGQTQPAPAAH